MIHAFVFKMLHYVFLMLIFFYFLKVETFVLLFISIILWCPYDKVCSLYASNFLPELVQWKMDMDGKPAFRRNMSASRFATHINPILGVDCSLGVILLTSVRMYKLRRGRSHNMTADKQLFLTVVILTEIASFSLLILQGTPPKQHYTPCEASKQFSQMTLQSCLSA